MTMAEADARFPEAIQLLTRNNRFELKQLASATIQQNAWRKVEQVPAHFTPRNDTGDPFRTSSIYALTPSCSTRTKCDLVFCRFSMKTLIQTHKQNESA